VQKKSILQTVNGVKIWTVT